MSVRQAVDRVAQPPGANYAQIRAGADGRLRILQITDFHNDVSDELALRTYDDIRALVAMTRPDLLAVTGDIWCGDDKPEQGLRLMRRDLAFLASLGTPWAFIWGNHDWGLGIAEHWNEITARPNALMPRGDGAGSYRIEVIGANDDSARWDLFFLNSGLEWHLPDDLAWFETECARLAENRAKILPAVVFVHIPLKEYEEARLAGDYIGEAHEEVLHWGDDGRVFDSFRRAGNVRACFVGHSHKNDFHVERDGVILAYGRATGHGGYGGEVLRKGAKLIVIDTRADSLNFTTVFPGS
jgi:hypothetical protein